MTVADLALTKVKIFDLVYGGDLEVEYKTTVRKKLSVDRSYVTGDFLVMCFDDGSTEVVKVCDCNMNDDDIDVTIEGEAVGENEEMYYRVVLAD